MKSILSALLILTASLATIPTAGAAQEACSLYRIQQGDTLREIAESAYGTDDFRPIWRANQSEIGRNPNIISVGTVLSLPCPDGAMPGETPQANTAPAGEARFSFVTANGYLPYTDESLDQSGLVTHLVRMAMLRAAPEAPIEIVFVNDWSAHLEFLLPRQTFDASFPWTRPGCETQGKLTQTELYACQNFLYSDPFYEIVDGFFSRKGSGLENVIAFDGLQGRTICRPEGYPTGHLEENGLMPPAVTLVQPARIHDCFSLLMAGRVDLVALDTRTGEYIMRDLNLSFEVTENPHLYTIQPLQVALSRANPESAELLDTLNRGLALMLESGEWASIVSQGLRNRPGLQLVN